MVAACGARTIILERSGRQARISGSRLPTVDGSTPIEVNPFNMDNEGCRSEESPMSLYGSSNPFKTTKSAPRSTGNGAKTQRSWFHGALTVVRRPMNLLTIRSNPISLKHKSSAVRLYQTGCDNYMRVVRAGMNVSWSQSDVDARLFTSGSTCSHLSHARSKRHHPCFTGT
jgi:hypothetical protein